jgi:hypothetical protein
VKAAGGEEAAEHWYIFPARIPAKRWVSVTDLSDGRKVASRSPEMEHLLDRLTQSGRLS